MNKRQQLEALTEARKQEQANTEVRALLERLGVERVLQATSVFLLEEAAVAQGEGDPTRANLLGYIGEEMEEHADDLLAPAGP